MTPLPGYDAWRTSEPREGPGEEIVYLVERDSPHDARQTWDPGHYDTWAEAEAAGKAWAAAMRAADNSIYRDDYSFEVIARDLLEAVICTCRWTGRRRCPEHGPDPDAAYDARLE